MNELTRMPQVGDRHGQWIWDGERWVCEDHDDSRQRPPLVPWPPFAYPSPPMQPPWYPGANAGVSFGTTAPPNPIRGHFWWNGTVLALFDGATWEPIGGSGTGTGGGSSTGPNPPSNPFDGELWFNGSALFIWDGNAWVPVSQTHTYVQATAPPAPNPGDLWWDGSQMRIWTGSAWAAVGPGATVGPVATTTHTLAFFSPADLTGPAPGAPQPLPWAIQPTINTQAGSWDPATYKYTPKLAGNYLSFTNMYYGGSQTYAGMWLAKNDAGAWQDTGMNLVSSASIAGPAATIGDYLEGVGMVTMNGTTDFLRMWAQTSNGVLYSTGNNSFWDIWLMP